MGSNVPLTGTMVQYLPKLLVDRKRKSIKRATSSQIKSLNLDLRLKKLLLTYEEVFGALPPPLSCLNLVQMHLKLKPELEKTRVRRRPYPAPQERVEEIEGCDMDSSSDLVRKRRGGGLAVGLWGFACLTPQCAGWSWCCSGCTRAVAPTLQRPGVYRCVGLRLAVGLIFGPFNGVLHPKDMLEGNCAVVGRSLAPFGTWSRSGGGRRSGAHCVACAVPYSSFGVPGP